MHDCLLFVKFLCMLPNSAVLNIPRLNLILWILAELPFVACDMPEGIEITMQPLCIFFILHLSIELRGLYHCTIQLFSNTADGVILIGLTIY